MDIKDIYIYIYIYIHTWTQTLMNDVLLIRNSEKLELRVYRKPTVKMTLYIFICTTTPTLKEAFSYVFTSGPFVFAPQNI